uniref:Chalcone/stilbene synthase N-terminal domain-containing protein n=1 Tax=Oryza meridionalis TaxID=40149 RepID=A0A0E0D4E1_9ORYZ
MVSDPVGLAELGEDEATAGWRRRTELSISIHTATNESARRRLIWVVPATMYFRVVDNAHFDNLVCQALFTDSASAVVIGADPVVATAAGGGGERPLFELVHATQTLIPETGGAILGLLREAGFLKMVGGAGVDDTDDDDRNALFWAVHPGGRAILDKVEGVLGLRLEKTRASRKVLADYGNMGSACAWFWVVVGRRIVRHHWRGVRVGRSPRLWPRPHHGHRPTSPSLTAGSLSSPPLAPSSAPTVSSVARCCCRFAGAPSAHAVSARTSSRHSCSAYPCVVCARQ